MNDDLYRAVIVRGFIDAKDEKQDSMYGAFLGLAASRAVKYIGVIFSRTKLDPEMPWQELLKTLKNAKADADNRNPALVTLEEQLYQCIDMSRLFQGVAKTRTIKQAEQAISRFCNEQMQLKAVTFAQFTEASDFDISLFLEEEKEASPNKEDVETPEGEEKPETQDDGENGEEAKDLFIRCEPLLDPVSGVAMTELAVGDTVFARLPDDSAFFKLFRKNFPDFDGVMTGEVTGVFVNELGTATVSLNMSDGISGLMKMSGKVRIKVAAHGKDGAGREGARRRNLRKTFQQLPSEMIFAGAGIVMLVGLLIIIIYILN